MIPAIQLRRVHAKRGEPSLMVVTACLHMLIEKGNILAKSGYLLPNNEHHQLVASGQVFSDGLHDGEADPTSSNHDGVALKG